MTKTRFVLAATMVVGLSATTLHAVSLPGGHAGEASLETLVDSIRSNRKALISVNLNLTDAEASKFWPLYDRYQKEIQAIGDRQVAVIRDYSASFGKFSNEKAMQLLDEYLATEADRIKVRRSYVEEFAKILPGRKVARFYQIENKMDAVLRYDLAATIPVIEQESGAPAK